MASHPSLPLPWRSVKACGATEGGAATRPHLSGLGRVTVAAHSSLHPNPPKPRMALSPLLSPVQVQVRERVRVRV